MSHFIFISLLTLLTASSAHAEAPQSRLRPIAPGAIAIDWEHSFDSAGSITVERENPANTWTFVAMVNTFTDLNLQASRTYRYRVCAVYDGTRDCDIWREAITMATPEPFSPPAVPRFISSSATTTSIVVEWASSSSYSFHQVRWAENGHGDGQNRVMDDRSRRMDCDRALPTISSSRDVTEHCLARAVAASRHPLELQLA